jgi:hypothetical protein
MQDLELFTQILGLQEPWHVEAVEVDEPSHRLDIYVGFAGTRKKGLFKGAEQARCPDCQAELPLTGDYEAVTLRHLPLAGLRTYLHVPPNGAVKCERESCVCIRPWANPGSKFTQDMENYIVEALQSAQTNQGAAKMAGITSAEAREISERSGVAPAPAGDATSGADEFEEFDAFQSYELIDSGDVPTADNRGWQRLINGEIPVQTDSVALRMLLQRVRGQIEKNPSDESRRTGAQMLRQFFVKNQQLLRPELEMVKSEAPALAAVSGSRPAQRSHIPAERDPVWQQLIRGDINIHTGAVALQMMLERVRLSAQQHDSEATRVAGARILRQFFIKHQSRLASEINQLHGQTAAPASLAGGRAAPLQTLPDEHDSIWQKLIAGDIRIESEAVSLKMLLERIRQAIARNPTEGNRVAGAKILRQYLLKNQHRHAAEISQLSTGGTVALAEQTGGLSVPAENHPNWQRLINGEIGIHTDAVSLKMLLERIRQAITKNPSPANRTAGAKILRQYFLKNQSRHAVEIRALNDLAPVAVETTMATGDTQDATIPDINHPSWQRLINGEFEIVTDAVGLKMMLERIRLSIENNPSQASRLAGAKILRQYFIKHQNKHRAELAQLRAA